MAGQEIRRLAAAAAPPHRVVPLIEETEIRKRVAALAEQIGADYARLDPVVISVLKGSFMFVADLIRALDFPVTLEFMRVTSYGNRVVTSGEVKLELDLANSVANRHVLLVEDVIDTGLTVDYLSATLKARKPTSVRVCTLLHKAANTVKVTPLDYVGFRIPNKFVVGYGLDYHGYYRNLPYIAEVEEVGERG